MATPTATPPKRRDPTLEEIRQRCEEIRAGWSPEVETNRRSGDCPAMIPVYRQSGVGDAVAFHVAPELPLPVPMFLIDQVRQLRRQGLSLRTIAAATGLGLSTVQRYCRGLPQPQPGNGEPEKIEGEGGRSE